MSRMPKLGTYGFAGVGRGQPPRRPGPFLPHVLTFDVDRCLTLLLSIGVEGATGNATPPFTLGPVVHALLAGLACGRFQPLFYTRRVPPSDSSGLLHQIRKP